MSRSQDKTIISQRPQLLYAQSLCGGEELNFGLDAPEFLLVQDGDATLICGKPATDGEEKQATDEGKKLTVGDLCVFNRGSTYTVKPSGQILLLRVGVGNLHIHGFEFGQMVADGDFSLVNAGKDFSALRTYMQTLADESNARLPLWEAIAESLLKTLVLTVERLINPQLHADEGKNPDYVRIKKYFDEHFIEIESVTEVCEKLHVNKYYLTHLFTDYEGVSPLQYLINKRINLACEYLESSNDDVAVIGKACGYSDPCYFSRVFKQVKKVTPLRYRYLFKLENGKI